MQTSYRFQRNHRDCSQHAGEPKLQIRVQVHQVQSLRERVEATMAVIVAMIVAVASANVVMTRA